MKTIEEKVKQTREEIQEKGLNYFKENPNILYQYPTGLGKSFTMIKSLDFVYSQKINKRLKCLLLEPEITLKQNIKEEFIKFGKEYLLSNIDIICYHSLKNVSKNYDIIVFDEAHHAFSEKRIESLKYQSPKFLLLLSATISNYQIKQFEYIFSCDFFVHKVSLKNAIKWGILPCPKIGLFKLKLDSYEINCQYVFCRGKKEKRKTIEVKRERDKWQYIKNKSEYPDLELIVNCTEQEKYNQLIYERDNKKDIYIKAKEEKNCNDFIEKSYFYSELCIKRFLAEIKTKYLFEFFEDAKDKRFIAFVGSIAQANELKDKIKDLNVISSETKNNQELIDKFNKEEIGNLVAIGKLQEGANLKNIDIVIISQLDGGTRAIIQKTGRGLRSLKPEIYLFYFKGTKDEEYLEKALVNFEKDMIVDLDYFWEGEDEE